MNETHRIDVWDQEQEKWLPFLKANGLDPATAQSSAVSKKTGVAARVVELATGRTVVAWNKGRRVNLK